MTGFHAPHSFFFCTLVLMLRHDRGRAHYWSLIVDNGPCGIMCRWHAGRWLASSLGTCSCRTDPCFRTSAQPSIMFTLRFVCLSSSSHLVSCCPVRFDSPLRFLCVSWCYRSTVCCFEWLNWMNVEYEEMLNGARHERQQNRWLRVTGSLMLL